MAAFNSSCVAVKAAYSMMGDEGPTHHGNGGANLPRLWPQGRHPFGRGQRMADEQPRRQPPKDRRGPLRKQKGLLKVGRRVLAKPM